MRKNWARSNYKEGLVHHLSEEARVGGNTEHLVLLENTRLRAWRTDQSWIQLITSRHQHLRIINLDYVFLHQLTSAGRSQYEWTILSRLFTRSFFVGWQCFFIASLISMSCFSTNQCSVERLIMIIKSSASLHLGTLPYSVLHLVPLLHRTFSNCRSNST